MFYLFLFYNKRSQRNDWVTPQLPETIILIDGFTQRLTRLVRIRGQLGIQYDRRPTIQDRYFRLTKRAPKASEHHLLYDKRLANASHSFTGQTRMDFLSPDGILKLTIDTLDDERAAGRLPAIVRRHFYYELINRPSADLVNEIESEYGVQWCPVMVNEMGDGSQRLYSVIEMRNIVRWPDLVNNWRPEIVKRPVTQVALEAARTTLRNEHRASTPLRQLNHSEVGQNRVSPDDPQQLLLPTMMMTRTYATLTQKNRRRQPSEKHLTPPQSDGGRGSPRERTRRNTDTSWSPSPIRGHNLLLLDDGDDQLFAQIDEATASGQIISSTPMVQIPLPLTTEPSTPTNTPRSGTKRPAQQAHPESAWTQEPLKRHKPIDEHLTGNGHTTTGSTKNQSNSPSDPNDSDIVTSDTETGPVTSRDPPGCEFGQRRSIDKLSQRPPYESEHGDDTHEIDDHDGNDSVEIQNDTTIVTEKESSFEIEDERTVTLDQLLTRLKEVTDQQPNPEEREKKAQQETERRLAEYEELCKESEAAKREAASQLAKIEKKAVLKKALANCERFASIDASDVPPPFETTGVKRYVINASHRDYQYIMGRVTGVQEPNLYMRRQLGGSESNQHGYYLLTRDMDLLETAKRTEKGAVALRIPCPTNNQEVLFFVRIVEPQKISDHVYKQWGQATRQERIDRLKLPGQRFYITVHTEPTIDFMLDPVEIDTHEKFLAAVRRQLTNPGRAIKSNQFTDLSSKSATGARGCPGPSTGASYSTDNSCKDNDQTTNPTLIQLTQSHKTGFNITTTTTSQNRSGGEGARPEAQSQPPTRSQPSAWQLRQEEQRQRANQLRQQKSAQTRPTQGTHAGNRNQNRRL